jgi:hypothetical protein
MTAPGDAARCHLVPGRSVVRPVRPTAEARTRPQSYTISEGANTPTIAKRDQKPPDDPSDNLLVLTTHRPVRAVLVHVAEEDGKETKITPIAVENDQDLNAIPANRALNEAHQR